MTKLNTNHSNLTQAMLSGCHKSNANRHINIILLGLIVVELVKTSVCYYIKLAATSQELGVGWETVNKYTREKINEYLNFPSYIKPYEVLQIGYPKDNETSETSRREVKDFVHWNEFSTKKVQEKDTESFLEEMVSMFRAKKTIM